MTKLPPINRAGCKWWRSKSRTIGKKPSKKLMKKLFEECRRAEICITHMFHWSLAGSPYKLYKRGKNRCKWCGVKLKAGD